MNEKMIRALIVLAIFGVMYWFSNQLIAQMNFWGSQFALIYIGTATAFLGGVWAKFITDKQRSLTTVLILHAVVVVIGVFFASDFKMMWMHEPIIQPVVFTMAMFLAGFLGKDLIKIPMPKEPTTA